MRRFNSPLAILHFILALALSAALPAFAQSHGPGAPPAAKATKAAETLRLPLATAPAAQMHLAAPDPEAIEAIKRANAASRLKRLEIGFGREIDAAAGSGAVPVWLPVAGGMAARWQVTSEQAQALRLGIDVASLPARAEMRFAGIGMNVVYGPFNASDVFAAGGTYWSPVLEGETATLEVFVPNGVSPSEVAIEIPAISHLFVSPSHPNAERFAKAAGFCESDLICRSASDAQMAQTGRSVARMTFTSASGGSSLCTGTLLNPTDGSFTPYFYSAAHCISTQARASTLTTHWFYETTGCGNNTVSPSYVQVAGGSTLLHADTNSDVFFARLNNSPPSGAIYAGWDAATIGSGTPVIAIHHPDGDFKKVSFGTVAGFAAPNGGSVQNFIQVNWNSIATGVVEPGSSGGGIFSGNAAAGYLHRGGLLGGPSSCTASPSELHDFYSRLDLVYPSISQYLNPQPQQPQGANILTNPGFESGRTGWTETSSGGFAIITNNSNGARSGSWYGLLGGGNNLTESLAQVFTVPSNQARLQFYYRITTAETIPQPFDVLTVRLVDAGTGSVLSTLASFSNTNATNGYAQSSSFDISAFAGRSVRLEFRVTTDGSLDTFFAIDDVSVTGAATSGGSNFTALWWNPNESGWGLNVNQQSDTVFATLFTYDTNGTPMWLVMSAGARTGGDTFSGELYRTTGPVFNAVPFTPITGANVTRVGTMTLAFSGSNAGTLSYSVNGVNVTKSIQKQVFGAAAAACSGASGSRSSATNYQDLWWNASESGWGINLTHQGNTIFATLFTYGSNNQGLWLVMSAGTRQGNGSYTGDLYRITGPAFNASPWTSVGVTRVGSMTLSFTNGENATLTYSVDGVNVTKQITRQVFGSAPPLCTG